MNFEVAQMYICSGELKKIFGYAGIIKPGATLDLCTLASETMM